jgi:hypothetical protein
VQQGSVTLVRVVSRATSCASAVGSIASTCPIIRRADGFHYRSFRHSVAKYVRKGHVQTNDHWKTSEVVPNQLREDAP